MYRIFFFSDFKIKNLGKKKQVILRISNNVTNFRERQNRAYVANLKQNFSLIKCMAPFLTNYSMVLSFWYIFTSIKKISLKYSTKYFIIF